MSLDDFTLTNDGQLSPLNPEPIRSARDDETDSMQRAFLAVYERFGSVGQSARAIGINIGRHYRWITDSDYAQRFADAKEKFIGRLEREAIRRAVNGIARKKFHKDEPVIDPETGKQYIEYEYSDRLLEMLLKANAPAKYRPVAENTPAQNNVTVTTQTSVANVGIRIVEDDNWYGNADRLTAAADGTHAANSDVAVPVQVVGLRSTLEQNG